MIVFAIVAANFNYGERFAHAENHIKRKLSKSLRHQIIAVPLKDIRMELHIFKCKSDESVFGFTGDITGINLPENGCKGNWDFWKTVTLERGISFTGSVSDEIIDGVKAIGYHISNAASQFDDL